MLLPLYEDTVQVARVLWVASGGPAQRSGIKVGDKVSVPAPREPISLPQHLFHLPSGSDLRREKLQSSPRSSRLSTLTLRLRERRAREREKLLSSSPWTRKQAISLERFKPVIDYERLCNEHCTVTESGCGMYRQLRSRLTWFKIALQFVLVAILQWHPQNFRIFGPPPPVTVPFTQPISTIIPFWTTPLPSSSVWRHLWMVPYQSLVGSSVWKLWTR